MGLGGEHLLQAVLELFCRQPSHGMVLAEQRGDPVPVRVRGAHLITGHRGLRYRTGPRLVAIRLTRLPGR